MKKVPGWRMKGKERGKEKKSGAGCIKRARGLPRENAL